MSQPQDYTVPTKIKPDTFFDILSMVFAIANAQYGSEMEKPKIVQQWNKFVNKTEKKPSFEGIATHFGIKVKDSKNDSVQMMATILQTIRDKVPGFEDTWDITNIRKSHILVTMAKMEQKEEPFTKATGKHTGTPKVTTNPPTSTTAISNTYGILLEEEEDGDDVSADDEKKIGTGKPTDVVNTNKNKDKDEKEVLDSKTVVHTMTHEPLENIDISVLERYITDATIAKIEMNISSKIQKNMKLKIDKMVQKAKNEINMEIEVSVGEGIE